MHMHVLSVPNMILSGMCICMLTICTHVMLPCTHVTLLCTHVMLPCTHVTLLCTHVMLPCTHVTPSEQKKAVQSPFHACMCTLSFLCMYIYIYMYVCMYVYIYIYIYNMHSCKCCIWCITSVRVKSCVRHLCANALRQPYTRQLCVYVCVFVCVASHVLLQAVKMRDDAKSTIKLEASVCSCMRTYVHTYVCILCWLCKVWSQERRQSGIIYVFYPSHM